MFQFSQLFDCCHGYQMRAEPALSPVCHFDLRLQPWRDSRILAHPSGNWVVAAATTDINQYFPPSKSQSDPRFSFCANRGLKPRAQPFLLASLSVLCSPFSRCKRERPVNWVSLNKDHLDIFFYTHWYAPLWVVGESNTYFWDYTLNLSISRKASL